MKRLPAGVDLSKLDIASTTGINPDAFGPLPVAAGISQPESLPRRMGRHGKPRKVELDGHTFDSEREARRYQTLKLMLAAGAIERLEVHPHYEITVNGEPILVYTPDFQYFDRGLDCIVVEDVKGPTTKKDRAWKIIKKLWRAVKGFDITEVTDA